MVASRPPAAVVASPPPWLVKGDDGKWGCYICAAARKAAASQKDASKWRYVAFAHFDVQALKTGNVRRHERCKAHRDALKAAGLPAAASQEGDEAGEGEAPTIDQIMAFWQRTRNGCSTHMPVEGFSNCGLRNRNLQWCIAETLRARFRTFLADSAAVSASLIQDGRGKHLMVRASACNDKLQRAHVNIGVITSRGGATNLCLATLTALEGFCTLGLGRPGDPHPDAPSPQVDKQLLAKLCASVRWWFTDAAYDEFAAGELLVTRPDANRLFSNLWVIGRERAHASRRILSRPQMAEPFLTEVADQFLWNYDSIASLIQHCPPWAMSGGQRPRRSGCQPAHNITVPETPLRFTGRAIDTACNRHRRSFANPVGCQPFPEN